MDLANRTCTAVFSIVPGLEDVRAEVSHEAMRTPHHPSLKANLLAERSALDGFDRHPCRTHGQRSEEAASLIPHFYLIPVPWRAISASKRRSALVRRASAALNAVLDSRAFALDSRAFALEPENHFLLSPCIKTKKEGMTRDE